MPHKKLFMKHICFFCHSVMAQSSSKKVIEEGKTCIRYEYNCPNCDNLEVEIIPCE